PPVRDAGTDADAGDAGDASPVLKSTRFFWLLDGMSDTFNGKLSVDLEAYTKAPTDDVAIVGPAVLIDANTALATAAAKGDVSHASIQVVTRANDSLTLQKRYVLGSGPNEIALRAANGFGIALTTPTTKAPATSDAALQIFAPG